MSGRCARHLRRVRSTECQSWPKRCKTPAGPTTRCSSIAAAPAARPRMLARGFAAGQVVVPRGPGFAARRRTTTAGRGGASSPGSPARRTLRWRRREAASDYRSPFFSSFFGSVFLGSVTSMITGGGVMATSLPPIFDRLARNTTGVGPAGRPGYRQRQFALRLALGDRLGSRPGPRSAGRTRGKRDVAVGAVGPRRLDQHLAAFPFSIRSRLGDSASPRTAASRPRRRCAAGGATPAAGWASRRAKFFTASVSVPNRTISLPSTVALDPPEAIGSVTAGPSPCRGGGGIGIGPVGAGM